MTQVSSAYPCGLCREDNRAAVYTWEAAQKVAAAPDKLEFVVLKVLGPLPQKRADEIASWLAQRAGVDPSTVKVSAFQKSVGFVFEKSRDKAGLVSEMKKSFPELSLHILTYEDPKPSNP
ncbi:MAG TPA: hypothetical protein VLJ37_05445 [bacterium]|nr:hypothetical protein [bacterium]